MDASLVDDEEEEEEEEEEAEALAFFLGGMVDEPSSEVVGSDSKPLLTRRWKGCATRSSANAEVGCCCCYAWLCL